MSTNYIQEGNVIDYTASGDDISSGDLVVIGNIAGIAKTDIADGETGAVHVAGVYSVPKANGSVTQGQKLYWSNANSNLTTTATGNKLVGIAAKAAASADANVQLLLNVCI